MNWDRGLKRITLVLSIIAAVVVGAVLFFYNAEQELIENQSRLSRERRDVFSEIRDGQYLLNKWNEKDPFPEAKALTILEKKRLLWKVWTGLEIDEKPLWLKAIEELEQRDVSLKADIEAKIQKKIEQLEKLKEVGWHTEEGKRLMLTPEDVWQIQHLRRIENLKKKVQVGLIELPIATAVGAVLGFGGVWVVYAAMIGIVWPVYKWISRGFAEDTQKDEQETNKLDKVNNC